MSETKPNIFECHERLTLGFSLLNPTYETTKLRVVKIVREKDIAEGWGRVQMPDVLDRKFPTHPPIGAGNVFPRENQWKNTVTGEEGRHHIHETFYSVLNKGGHGVRSPVGGLQTGLYRLYNHCYAGKEISECQRSRCFTA